MKNNTGNDRKTTYSKGFMERCYNFEFLTSFSCCNWKPRLADLHSVLVINATLEPSLLAIIVVTLKRMIQKRLFRKSHPDEDHCLFRYQCEFSVKYQDLTINFIFLDKNSN